MGAEMVEFFFVTTSLFMTLVLLNTYNQVFEQQTMMFSNGPYLLMSDDVRRNRTSDTYYTNSLVKFDANSSVVPLTMYLASKRYGPIAGALVIQTYQ